uniref:site-specific DNA-methyltransferase (cytosine-N(4)-specific) n=1 Tax=Adineta vaga TaxID=104782 RepID=A0AAB0B2A3_ADIVA|nr:Chain A, DNA cytosine-N4 methyltransferase [Adineta vaga]8S9O_A Chain A, DNA cytosine-N4 methyltransferase [Adineta vaga]8S9O_B Chain B, DNA cytosine-N4 methyltransferase [Adineta vaga]
MHRESSLSNSDSFQKKKLKSFTNKYVVLDSLEGLRSLPDNSVQCVVTSPPYNKLGLREGRPYLGQIIYDTYDDNMNEDDYQKWQLQILNEINRILKPGGSAFYNHKDRRFCKRDHPPEKFLSDSDLELYQTIIWDRGSTVNQNARYFRPYVEKIFWFTKSISGESTTPKFHRDRLPEYFKGVIWRIPPDKRNKHPAPFPAILAEICILTTTEEGDLVLDPFAGSGTTLVAAASLKRSYLGFDISSKYQKMFHQRLATSKSKVHLWLEHHHHHH